MAVEDEPIASVTQYSLGFLIYTIPFLHQVTMPKYQASVRKLLNTNWQGGRKPLQEIRKAAFGFNNNGKCWR